MKDDPLDDFRSELNPLVEELRATQGALRDLSTRVLLDPAAEDDAEPHRRDHLQRRRELLARIASIVLRAVDAGATIEITATAPASLAAATESEPSVAQAPADAVDDHDGTAQPDDDLGDDHDEVPDDSAAIVHAIDEPPATAGMPVAAAAPPDLSRLQGSLMPAWARTSLVEVPGERPLDIALLAAILTRVGPPPTDLDMTSLLPEVERLTNEVFPSQIGDWKRLPKPIQRQLVAMTAARARHVQDRLPPSAPLEYTAPLGRIFSALTRFSSMEQPGFVVGLQRDHEPNGMTWVDDAQAACETLRGELPVEMTRQKPTPATALEMLRAVLRDGATSDVITDAITVALDAGVAPEDGRLLDVIAPRAEELASALASKARFKRLRRALRERLTGDEDDVDEGAEGDVPAAWSHWSATVDKRAVIIGGDLREEARARIERAFRFASLRWITTDQMRGAQQLGQGIAGGSVDLVIVLARFISHKIQEQVIPACKEAGVPWVVVEKGYGVTQVRLAIERFLG